MSSSRRFESRPPVRSWRDADILALPASENFSRKLTIPGDRIQGGQPMMNKVVQPFQPAFQPNDANLVISSELPARDGLEFARSKPAELNVAKQVPVCL